MFMLKTQLLMVAPLNVGSLLYFENDDDDEVLLILLFLHDIYLLKEPFHHSNLSDICSCCFLEAE